MSKKFTETFKLLCNEPVIVYIAADNAFELFINGWKIQVGDDINKVYKVEIPKDKLKFCQKNVL